MIAGVLTFFWYALIARMKSPVQIFDTLGLGLFTVTGAGKAIAFHLGPSAAVLMGVLTGIGAGIARDLLVSEVRSSLPPNCTQSPPSRAQPSSSSATPFFRGPRQSPPYVGLFVSRYASWRSGTAGSFQWLSSRIDSVVPARRKRTQ